MNGFEVADMPVDQGGTMQENISDILLKWKFFNNEKLNNIDVANKILSLFPNIDNFEVLEGELTRPAKWDDFYKIVNSRLERKYTELNIVYGSKADGILRVKGDNR